MIGRNPVRGAELKAMRKKLRTWGGTAMLRTAKNLVEPVFGVLKEQRGMRGFRRRGLAAVAVEFTLAAIAYRLDALASPPPLSRIGLFVNPTRRGMHRTTAA